MIAKPDVSGGFSQYWYDLRPFDFQKDGTPELVAVSETDSEASVHVAGIYVITEDAGGVHLAYSTRSELQSQAIIFSSDSLTFREPRYFLSDGHCCPNEEARIVVGVRPDGDIGEIENAVKVLPVDTPLKAADRFFYAWQGYSGPDRPAMLAFATPDVVAKALTYPTSVDHPDMAPISCANGGGIWCDSGAYGIRVASDALLGYRVVEVLPLPD